MSKCYGYIYQNGWAFVPWNLTDTVAARSVFLTPAHVQTYSFPGKLLEHLHVQLHVWKQLQSTAAGLHTQYERAVEGVTKVEMNLSDLEGGNETSMLFFFHSFLFWPCHNNMGLMKQGEQIVHFIPAVFIWLLGQMAVLLLLLNKRCDVVRRSKCCNSVALIW